tara:strand:+ start:1459 stop:1767 length:309 start_codon:yes stop_codon:yes gene_type:complete
MTKNYYNIDEIAQILNEQKHTLRFWETRISKLKVLRTHSGHRLYNYENLLLLKKVKELVDVQKLTLDGVNDYFSNSKLKNKRLGDNFINELRDLLSLLKKSD